MTDNETIVKAQKQMNACALEIAKMSHDVADAKTVKEFSGDRLKRALSIEVSRFLTSGDSGVAAEHKARASTQYGAHLSDLEAQFKAAMRVIEQFDAAKIKFESARSILSCERTKLGLI